MTVALRVEWEEAVFAQDVKAVRGVLSVEVGQETALKIYSPLAEIKLASTGSATECKYICDTLVHLRWDKSAAAGIKHLLFQMNLAPEWQSAVQKNPRHTIIPVHICLVSGVNHPQFLNAVPTFGPPQQNAPKHLSNFLHQVLKTELLTLNPFVSTSRSPRFLTKTPSAAAIPTPAVASGVLRIEERVSEE